MVSKQVLFAIIVGAFVGWWQGEASTQSLNLGTAEWRPWQVVEDGHLTGITPGILQELSKRTGCAMNVRPFPHKRMMAAFEKGGIDMEPTVNPSWRDCQSHISVYTIPFYTTGDIVLVRKKNAIHATSVRDFYGMNLGCGLGYYYPEGFQEAFNRGDIHREDNPVSEKNLQKLALERLDGIIVDKVQARYLLKKANLDPADFVTAYRFKPSKLSLRLHRSRQAFLPALNKAIEEMIADGTIDRIVAKYVE